MRETLSLGCLVFWLGRISLTHDINGWWFGGWPKCDTNLIILHNITTCFMVFDDDDVQNASLLNLEPPSLNLPGIERHSSLFNYAFSCHALFQTLPKLLLLIPLLLLIRVDHDDLGHHAGRSVERVGARGIHASHLGVALIVVLDVGQQHLLY